MNTLLFWILLIGLLLILFQLIIHGILAFLETKGRPQLTPDMVPELLKKEKSKLGISEKIIKCRFTKKKNSRISLENGIYYINFGTKARDLTVKHEVFHVYREKPEHINRKGIWLTIRYFFWYENRAKLYTVFNIKI